ncbi:MAG: thioredoxin family protein [Rubrobacteraceae bacterium]|nr:thioredoxin family protein [Rubrobacteraceae bacterium]
MRAPTPPLNTATKSRVRVLYFEGCPGGEASGEVLREVLSEVAPGIEVEMVELPAREFGDLGTPGSPTILLDGKDLFPADETRPVPASCCRLYATPEGIKSHPTAGMVREALGGSEAGGTAGF